MDQFWRFWFGHPASFLHKGSIICCHAQDGGADFKHMGMCWQCNLHNTGTMVGGFSSEPKRSSESRRSRPHVLPYFRNLEGFARSHLTTSASHPCGQYCCGLRLVFGLQRSFAAWFSGQAMRLVLPSHTCITCPSGSGVS